MTYTEKQTGLVVNTMTLDIYRQLSSQGRISSDEVYCITDIADHLAESANGVDGAKTWISAAHVSQAQYEAMVRNGSALSNTIYIVSSDVEDMYGERVVNVGTPVAAKDAVTKEYVDNIVGNLENVINGI